MKGREHVARAVGVLVGERLIAINERFGTTFRDSANRRFVAGRKYKESA